ncbi:MAG TPA: DUF4105 domain-containing protein [Kofleriaceae bacterium]
MRRVVVLLAVAGACALCPGVARAQPAHLSPAEVPGGAIEPEPPTIELLTFGVGARIFERYGHAALCLRYHRPEHSPVCFNYGVTNFTAGLVIAWNFLRQQQKFWVEPTSAESMYGFYEAEDRDIWRQVLPITGDAARAIEARLWHDVRPENRYYYYDHFLDNCSTRLRDMIDQATHGALRAGADVPYPSTFRELGRRGLTGMPILLVMSDLIAGRSLDEHPTVWQAMFLPEIFRHEVASRLGARPELVYRRRGSAAPERGSIGRLDMLALGVAFAFPLVIAHWLRRFETGARIWVTIELVLLGLVVWGLAILSSIPAVRYNEAVFVVTPVDAVLPLLSTAWRRRYAFARLGVLAAVSLLGVLGAFHQPLGILILVVFLPMATIALDLPHGLSRAVAGASAAEGAGGTGEAGGG